MYNTTKWCLVSLLFVVVFQQYYCLQEEGLCRFSTTELTLDCSHCNLTQVPRNIPANITKLLLNGNSIFSIPDMAFETLSSLEYLDVSYNRHLCINKLSTHSFYGLVSLLYLDISHNCFGKVPTGIFSNLSSLRILNITSKYCDQTNQVSGYLDYAIKDLTNLEELNILGLPNSSFGIGFEAMIKLKILTLDSSGLFCRLDVVNKNMFHALRYSPLEVISMMYCHISAMDPYSLSMLGSLRSINLACNAPLTYNAAFQVIQGITSDHLTTVILDHIGDGFSFNVLEPKGNMTSFRNIEQLSLRSNKLAVIDPQFLTFVPALKYIAFGCHNDILAIRPNLVDGINELNKIVDKMDITTFDVSYYSTAVGNACLKKYCSVGNTVFFVKPPASIIPPIVKDLDRTLHNGTLPSKPDWKGENVSFLNIPSSFEYAMLDHFGEYSHFVFNGRQVNVDNNILFINLSHTIFSGMGGLLLGLNQLQGFDLSSCGIKFIHPDFFIHFPKLTHLWLANNQIENSRNTISSLFGRLSTLEYLDISNNGLKKVDANLGKKLDNLVTLILNDNSIKEVDITFGKCKHMEMLALSNNLLISLSSSFMNTLEQCRHNEKFEVNLAGNPFICSCSTLDFLEWVGKTKVLITNKDDYTCLYNNKTVRLNSVKVEDLRQECKPMNISILITVVTPFVVFILTVTGIIVSLYNRWTLRWHFYLLKRRFRYLGGNTDTGCNALNPKFYYHAFVAHNHNEDYEWVIRTLLPHVEQEWGLKLCVGQRDFMVGTAIAENIVNAIDTSRKTILVITPGFVQSEWCDFEMHMALTRGHHNIVLIYKKNTEIKDMGKVLRKLMKTINYIPYEEDINGLRLFWERLRDALVEPLGDE